MSADAQGSGALARYKYYPKSTDRGEQYTYGAVKLTTDEFEVGRGWAVSCARCGMNSNNRWYVWHKAVEGLEHEARCKYLAGMPVSKLLEEVREASLRSALRKFTVMPALDIPVEATDVGYDVEWLVLD